MSPTPSSEAWTAHPDPYYIQYKKIKVVVASLTMLKIRASDGVIVDYDTKVEYGSEMNRAAYNMNGDLIGSAKKARFLCRVLGIMPEKISPKHKMCSIGRSRKDGKWYAFSNRGYTDFGVGDIIQAKSPLGKYLKLTNDFTIDSKQLAMDMAVIVAEAIS